MSFLFVPIWRIVRNSSMQHYGNCSIRVAQKLPAPSNCESRFLVIQSKCVFLISELAHGISGKDFRRQIPPSSLVDERDERELRRCEHVRNSTHMCGPRFSRTCLQPSSLRETRATQRRTREEMMKSHQRNAVVTIHNSATPLLHRSDDEFDDDNNFYDDNCHWELNVLERLHAPPPNVWPDAQSHVYLSNLSLPSVDGGKQLRRLQPQGRLSFIYESGDMEYFPILGVNFVQLVHLALVNNYTYDHDPNDLASTWKWQVRVIISMQNDSDAVESSALVDRITLHLHESFIPRAHTLQLVQDDNHNQGMFQSAVFYGWGTFVLGVTILWKEHHNNGTRNNKNNPPPITLLHHRLRFHFPALQRCHTTQHDVRLPETAIISPASMSSTSLSDGEAMSEAASTFGGKNGCKRASLRCL